MKKVFLSILAIIALSSTVEAAGFGGQVKDSNPLTNPNVKANAKVVTLIDEFFEFDCAWWLEVRRINSPNVVDSKSGHQIYSTEQDCKDRIEAEKKKLEQTYPPSQYVIENIQR